MKIIVNVHQRHLSKEWLKLGIAGFRFQETDDGSFNLHLTSDLARTYAIEAKMAEALDPLGDMPAI